MEDARTNHALHELARLYLTHPEDDGDFADPSAGDKHGMTPSSAADRDPELTDVQTPTPHAVLVGHLPGFANLWINQYAQQLCERLGPVGVVHLGDDQVDVDLFQPGLPAPTRSASDAPSPESLTEAIDQAGPVRQWLVHLTDPSDDDRRTLAGELGRWTLLTGADEAAIVAAYRLLKQWVEPTGNPTGDPRIELAFLGCEPSAADQAAQRIGRAAGEFLDVAITIGSTQAKMQPVNRRRLGSFDPPDPLSDLLDLLIADPPHHPRLADDPPAAHEPPKHGMTRSAAADRDQPAPAPHAADEPPKHGMTRSSATDRDQPAHPPGLAAHLPDLAPMQARCPRGEAVELALDDVGRLHLLLDASATADPLPLLLRVRAWAVEHADLLAMTVANRDLDRPAQPVLHLFTAEPRRFIDHAQTLRLHLLLPVTIGARTQPVHVELS